MAVTAHSDLDLLKFLYDIVSIGFAESGFMPDDNRTVVSLDNITVADGAIRPMIKSYVVGILNRFYLSKDLGLKLTFLKDDEFETVKSTDTMYAHEMLMAGYNPDISEAGQEIALKHAGDYSTFCAGLFPEWLTYRNHSPENYVMFARSAYAGVAAIKERRHGPDASVIFEALSTYAPDIVVSLNYGKEHMNLGKDEWELSIWRLLEGKLDWMEQ